jgi:hypothetical protein
MQRLARAVVPLKQSNHDPSGVIQSGIRSAAHTDPRLVMPSTSRDTTKAGIAVDIYFMRCAVIFNVKAMHTSRWLELLGRSQPTWTAIVRLHG